MEFIMYCWNWLTRNLTRALAAIGLNAWLENLHAPKVEDQFWSQALEELNTSGKTTSLWAQALYRSDGNIARAEALYLKERSKQLQSQFTEARAAAAVRSKAEVIKTITPFKAPEEIEPQIELLITELLACGCRVSRTSASLWLITSPEGIHFTAATEHDFERVLVEIM